MAVSDHVGLLGIASIWFQLGQILVFAACAPACNFNPRRVQRAGLGLTIACDVVQNHGGTITLGTAAQRGLLLRIALPIDAAIRDAT